MKRISALLISITLLFIALPVYPGADAIELPKPEPIYGVEDIGTTPAVLFDVDTGAVIYENNSDRSAKPGSLTVIMTALLLIEDTDPVDWDTPLPALKEVNSSWSRRGAQMGLEKGMTPTRRDLLFALLLEGAADASFVTANIVSGSEAGFVSLMNEKAAEIGMMNTSFDNGFGLGSSGHYTTAYDMSLLTAEAMKSDLFVSSVRESEYTCSEGCGRIRLVNSNTALGSAGCIGLKFGGDSEKEHSVIIAQEAGELKLAAVILEAPYDSAAYSFADRLISAGFSRYATSGGYVSLLPTNAVYIARSGARLYSSPNGTEAEALDENEAVTVCGSHVENGVVWFLAANSGRYLWMKADEAVFSCYTDDILIENGPELSSELSGGDPLRTTAYFTTRHRIASVKLTIALPDGRKEFEAYRFPNVHGWSSLESTSVYYDLSFLVLPAGIYTCTVEVTAEASIPGSTTMVFTKTCSSILSVGADSDCVSYNPNGGDDAPNGECFFDSFTIPNETPTRFGMEFTGWSENPDGGGRIYMPGEAVTREGSLTLYAVWKAAASNWSNDFSVNYIEGLILTGSVSNPAGITGVRVLVEGKSKLFDEYVPCHANEVLPGTLFDLSEVKLDKGDYTISVYASTVGTSLQPVTKTVLSVVPGQEATPAPEGTDEPAPTPAPKDNGGFSFLSIPIAVWFVIGALVVIGLIVAIIVIIKRG